MFTNEIIEKYILGSGQFCPFCHYDGVIQEQPDTLGGNTISQIARCIECGSKWREVYMLHSIENIL